MLEIYVCRHRADVLHCRAARCPRGTTEPVSPLKKHPRLVSTPEYSAAAEPRTRYGLYVEYVSRALGRVSDQP